MMVKNGKVDSMVLIAQFVYCTLIYIYTYTTRILDCSHTDKPLESSKRITASLYKMINTGIVVGCFVIQHLYGS